LALFVDHDADTAHTVRFFTNQCWEAPCALRLVPARLPTAGDAQAALQTETCSEACASTSFCSQSATASPWDACTTDACCANARAADARQYTGVSITSEAATVQSNNILC